MDLSIAEVQAPPGWVNAGVDQINADELPSHTWHRLDDEDSPPLLRQNLERIKGSVGRALEGMPAL